jgi:hypothetical protein
LPVVRARLVIVLATGLAGVLAQAGCRSPFGYKYEYEEQLYLRVDGAATLVIDASIPALVALRGVAVDPSASAATDRAMLRHLFEAAGCQVDNVGQPWRRLGRRFVQIRLSTPDVRTLSKCGLASWSTYTLEPIEGGLRYRQTVGAPAAAPSTGVGQPAVANWDGSELVAFKLHLPSRVIEHNVRRLDVDEPGDLERGNILTWEQRLTDRRAGKPVAIDVTMNAKSILYTTLWLFGGAFVAAVSVLALVVWLTVRRGRKRVAARQS